VLALAAVVLQMLLSFGHVHLRGMAQRRRNCLSLRISSGSSIASMSHDRSLSLRGSLSDRALRPRPKAAALLSLLWRVSFLAPDNNSKQRGAFF